MKWEKTVSEAPAPSEMFAWLEIPIITQVRVLIAHGIPESLSKAASLLNEFLSMSKKCRFVNQTIEGLVLQALLLKKQGDMKEALKIMNEVVFLAGSGNWIRPFIEAGPEMADLLNHLPESESRSSFLERVRKKFKNMHYDNQ